MIDNDQSTIIEAPEVYKSIPHSLPTYLPTAESREKSHLKFELYIVTLICLSRNQHYQVKMLMW